SRRPASARRNAPAAVHFVQLLPASADTASWQETSRSALKLAGSGPTGSLLTVKGGLSAGQPAGPGAPSIDQQAEPAGTVAQGGRLKCCCTPSAVVRSSVTTQSG